MIAIIDFDNIPLIDRQRGLVHIADRVATAIGPEILSQETSLQLRLYGGWFAQTVLSHAAQQLVPQIMRDFPRRIAVSAAGINTQITTRAEMAYSLACDPATTLTYTYRPRSVPPNLKCSSAPFSNCIDPSACPIMGLEALINNGKCPKPTCSVSPDIILTKPEQKLVDAMMIVDLLHWSQKSIDPIALVSTDDDLWPGIRLALLHGAKLVHIHPKPGRLSPQQYMPLITGTYTQAPL